METAQQISLRLPNSPDDEALNRVEDAVRALLDAAANDGLAPAAQESSGEPRAVTTDDLFVPHNSTLMSNPAAVLERFSEWARRRDEKLEAARVELRKQRDSLDPECTFSPTNMPSVRGRWMLSTHNFTRACAVDDPI